MKKYCAVFFTAALLFAAAILAGGCGGSGGGSVALDTQQEDTSYYEPPNLTEEQLIELAQTQVDPSEFDLAELNEIYSADSLTASDTRFNEEEYLARKIWLEAAGFFAGDGKYSGGNYGAMTTSVTEHPQSDGSIMRIRQSRFLYVYRWTTPYYEVFDERITSTVKQHYYTDAGCQHGVHGTDCVGLIWNAAYRAGITLWAAEGTDRRRWGPSTLTTASKWKEWFKNAQDVSSEIGSSKPQPGDIVSYLWYDNEGRKCEHVGIAAKVRDGDNDRIVIIHCAGRTTRDYTCNEYKQAGETSSILNESSQLNGVTAHEYNVSSGIIAPFNLEKKRLRLYVESESEQQEQNQSNENQNQNQEQEPQNQNQDQNQPVDNTPGNTETGTITANSLNGTWTGSGSGTGTYGGITAPVNTELRYTIRNVNLSSGTAEIDIYDKTTNAQYGVNIERGVNYDNKSGGGYRDFSVTHSGSNQWTFIANYSDGEDNIVITLNSPTTGTLRLYGVMWNEDNPSERTTFDITCNITKQ